MQGLPAFLISACSRSLVFVEFCRLASNNINTALDLILPLLPASTMCSVQVRAKHTHRGEVMEPRSEEFVFTYERKVATVFWSCDFVPVLANPRLCRLRR